VVCVFGATGFLGRYVVSRFGKEGSQVVVPFRGDEHAWRHLRVAGDLGNVHFVVRGRRGNTRTHDPIDLILFSPTPSSPSSC
jgi:uncharacterized protein YbjT (DUF2867 family)